VDDPGNTKATEGFEAAWVEKGTITDVDLTEYTCTVLSEYSGKDLPGVQIMSPYMHPHAGEGIFALPDIGAICMVCFPSDNDPPFVLGYLSALEAAGTAESKNLDDSVGQVGNATEEVAGTTSTGAYKAPKTKATFRGGRMKVNPGTIVLAGRDGNHVVLHRGGIVEIGSTPMAQRFYIPVMNTIRDVAENLHAMTPGGQMSWTVDRKEDDAGGSASTVYRLSLRDKVNDAKATVQVRMGHVDSSKRIEVQVAPGGVDVADGTVSVSPVYKMTVDSSGNQVATLKGKLTYQILAGRSVTITGTDTLTVSGVRSVTLGGESKTLTGVQSTKGTLSTEIWSGAKIIQAPMVMVGPLPADFGVLASKLILWLTEHLVAGHITIPQAQKAKMILDLKKIVSKTFKLSL